MQRARLPAAELAAVTDPDAALLRSVVLSLGDAVLVASAPTADRESRVVFVNRAFSEMTGYSAADVIGKPAAFFVGPAGIASLQRTPVEKSAKSPQLLVEQLGQRKDGSQYVAELSLAPIGEEQGGCSHWVSVQRDISARRSAEDERLRERFAEEKRLALEAEREERERVEARLAYTAVHDNLTGLHTRSHFILAVQGAIARARVDPGYGFAVVVADLDRFRFINEQAGHRTGDLILRDLARRFETLAGSHDTVARLDADEFGFLIEESDDMVAVSLAEAVLAEIALSSHARTGEMTLSASIGIARLTSRIDDPEALIRDAEVAVGHAYRNGGGRYAVVTPEMLAAAESTQRIRADLPGAVERGELELHFQPLIDIAMSRLYGFEGLVRWNHPERGLVSPAAFIPAAEEDGLILEIGRWVLEEGCRKSRAFQAAAGEPLLMSLNVASAQLRDPRFFNHLQDVLAATALDPKTLQLEITESAFLSGGTVVGALFARIRALGVKIAFDDFGTGYSSLSYLERFQIDSLKIDQSFVMRIQDVSAKTEILRMIIALAHALGVDLIAEGVETHGQCHALGDLGCTHLQGYLFSRPLPEVSVLTLLEPSSVSSGALRTLLDQTGYGAGSFSLSEAERRELREQVDAAIQAHHDWMDYLHRAAAGGPITVDPIAIAREDTCPIGIWLSTTISPSLRSMPLYAVTKSRHAVFHRSMSRLIGAVSAGRPDAALSLRPDGDVAMVAGSLIATLRDWRAFADRTVLAEASAA